MAASWDYSNSDGTSVNQESSARATPGPTFTSRLRGPGRTQLRETSSPPRPAGTPAERPAAPGLTPAAEALPWDDNGNGRISCAEARAHGIAPVRRGHPAYRYMRDGDGDGVVCE